MIARVNSGREIERGQRVGKSGPPAPEASSPHSHPGQAERALGARHGHRPTEAVATTVCSARSLIHLKRGFESLRQENRDTAVVAAQAIRSAIDNLGTHPLQGRRIHGDIREVVISYGATSYIALYRFLVPQG